MSDEEVAKLRREIELTCDAQGAVAEQAEGLQQLMEATSRMMLALDRPRVPRQPNVVQAKAVLERPTPVSCELPPLHVGIASWRGKTAGGACSRAW